MKEPEQIKLHPLLVRAVAQALMAIFFEHRYADKVIEQALKSNPKAGSRDRAFIAETTYELLRYYRYYTEILGKTPRFETDFWQLIGIHFFLKSGKLPDWQEFKTLKTKEIEARAEKAKTERALRESIPEWLDEMAAQQLPESWDKTLHWLNKPAQVVLRANRLKTDRAALQHALMEEGIETKPVGTGDALVLARRQNIFLSPTFKKGWFEVQDYSSQLVAAVLAPEPGMRVVDACAGGGGKTLHLAALLQNKGSLIALDTFAWKLDELRLRARRAGATNIETRPIALDTFAWKLDELRLRARRAGATNIETRPIESRKTIKRLYNSADRLLLDVPCSGLGVLRRNPDAKWKLKPEQIEQLRATQQEILQSYCLITKPGGRMVYATCSILPAENQDQIETFLASDPGKNFRLLEERKILPQDEGFDGFYIALLERNEG